MGEHRLRGRTWAYQVTSHPTAQTIIDELLPLLHARERDVMSAALSTNEQRELLRLIAKLQDAARQAQSTPAPDAATRRRPAATPRP